MRAQRTVSSGDSGGIFLIYAPPLTQILLFVRKVLTNINVCCILLLGVSLKMTFPPTGGGGKGVLREVSKKIIEASESETFCEKCEACERSEFAASVNAGGVSVMIDDLYISANVYDVDGILVASFVGNYDTLCRIFTDSVDDKHCPPYFQKRIHDGFVKITDYQLIVSQKIVSDDKWVYPCIPVSDLVLPFDVFIRGDFGGDEPLGALLKYAFEYRRKSEDEQHG